MRKERNNFFQESSYNGGYYINNNQFPQMPSMGEMQSYSSFYNSNSNYGEINSRISRLERQVNRLESRINKLESINITSNNITDDIDKDTNMYMI